MSTNSWKRRRFFGQALPHIKTDRQAGEVVELRAICCDNLILSGLTTGRTVATGSFDGFTFTNAAIDGRTFSGTIRVYGYSN
jgi:hypothetical protein